LYVFDRCCLMNKNQGNLKYVFVCLIFMTGYAHSTWSARVKSPVDVPGCLSLMRSQKFAAVCMSL
jgi:hypothetical protein